MAVTPLTAIGYVPIGLYRVGGGAQYQCAVEDVGVLAIDKAGDGSRERWIRLTVGAALVIGLNQEVSGRDCQNAVNVTDAVVGAVWPEDGDRVSANRAVRFGGSAGDQCAA